MLKQYTLNEEMAKMKHLMLFEAGQLQQQAADPMASYTTTMQNWGTSLANAQSQYPNSARAIQVAFSVASRGEGNPAENDRMFDQAIRMASDPAVKKMLQDYRTAYKTYANAYKKTYNTPLPSGVNYQKNAQGQITGYTYNQNNPLVNAGATQDFNQRLSTQIDATGAQDEQAWNNLQAAKSAYTADMDNQAANAQNAQNSYYANNSFTLPGVKTYDGKNVVTRDVSVQYDPQRKGFYYMTGANNGTKTWLTNDQVKNLSGNTGYTNYSQGAANAYRNAYQPSQSAQQSYDNALSAYNQASTNYTNALSTPRVNTWSPQAYSQQQTGGQPQQTQQQQQVQPQQQQQVQLQQRQQVQPQQQQQVQPQQQQQVQPQQQQQTQQ